jgi:polyphenol oxidase
MILRNANGFAYYQFEHLAAYPEVDHAVFPRTDGYSREPFHRLNVSLSVGDDPADVRRNRERVCRCLNGSELVFARQVHGDGVLVIAEDPAHPGPRVGDAMVSARAGKTLVVQVADCQPILFYDPKRRVVANAHCGWRGSLAGVAVRTVQVMAERFGSDGRDVLAGIGPSLGPCCAEFVNFRSEIPPALWSYRRGPTHFDFWAITRDQLIGAGLSADHVETSGICTRCNTERFFSYRGEKTTGRFPAAIGLREGAGRVQGAEGSRVRGERRRSSESESDGECQ